jgi:hypothetical protein
MWKWYSSFTSFYTRFVMVRPSLLLDSNAVIILKEQETEILSVPNVTWHLISKN